MYNIIAQLISSDILCDCYLLFWNKVRLGRFGDQ